ncbi:unnamed protein product [Parajaminaea phylloscopi]
MSQPIRKLAETALHRLQVEEQLLPLQIPRGIPLAWSGLERLLKHRAVIERDARSALDPMASALHLDRLRLHDQDIQAHVNTHNIMDLRNPDSNWMSLAIVKH